jgi:Salmonella virulence plasmid 65kDa B protein
MDNHFSCPFRLLKRLEKRLFSLCIVGLLSTPVFSGIEVTPAGAAIYSHPLTVMPGIAGFVPKLALAYNSQSGMSLLGQGWQLQGLSSISRCPKTKLQDGFDYPYADYNGDGNTTANNVATSSDAFCLNGQRLIKDDTTGTNQPGVANGEYRLEHDAFSRIKFASYSNQWVVDTKEGLHYTYGGTSAVVGMGNNNLTRLWPLGSIKDNSGNTIKFTMVNGASTADVRISSISYGTNNSNQINFFYDPRPDLLSAWTNSVQNVSDQRIRMIQETWQNPSDTQGTTKVEVRRYLLSYAQSATTNGVANTGRSLLTKIQECVPLSGQGAAVMQTTSNTKSSQKCLPPIKFGYGQSAGGFDGTALSAPSFTDAAGYSDPTVYSTFQEIDADGNGVKDICARTNAGLMCWIAKRSGNQFIYDNSGWVTQADFSNANNLDYAHIQYADVDSDGKLDACARFSDGVRCYLNSGTGFNKRIVYGPAWTNANGWNRDIYANSLTFIDMTGDSYADVCERYSDGLHCAFYNPSTGTFGADTLVSAFLSDSNLITNVYADSYDTSTTLPPDSAITETVDTLRTLRFEDFNQDGYVDLCIMQVFANNKGFFVTNKSALVEVSCRENDGTGTFKSTTTRWVASNPIALLSDFARNPNSDGTSSVGTTIYPLVVDPFVFTDLNGDNQLDYCFRNKKGLRCWMNAGMTYFTLTVPGYNINTRLVDYADVTIPGLTNADSSGQGLFPDNDSNGNATGWGNPNYYSSIRFQDLNLDSKFDVCGRTSLGMSCYRNTLSPQSCLTSKSNTSQVSLFDAYSCSATSGFIADPFGFAPTGCTAQGSGLCLSDAAGYGTDNIYKTVRFFTLPNGKSGLFVRSATGASQIYVYGGVNALTPSSQTNTELLTSVQEGAAPAVMVNYQMGTLNNSVYLKGPLSTRKNSVDVATYPAFDIPATMPLVYSMSTLDPFNGQTLSTTYQYLGLAAQIKRGLLGFGRVRKTIQPANTWVETTYRQDWPFIGLPDTVLVGNGNKVGMASDTSVSANWLTSTQYVYSAQDLSNTSNNAPLSTASVENGCGVITPLSLSAQSLLGRYFVYPYEVTETTRSINNLNTTTKQVVSDNLMDTLKYTTVNTMQGNPVCVSVKTRDKLNNLVFEKVTTNTWDTTQMNTSSWMLNLLQRSIVTHKAPNSSFATVSLGAVQGNYSATFNPNDPTSQMGPVYPNIMPWFLPIMSLLLQ